MTTSKNKAKGVFRLLSVGVIYSIQFLLKASHLGTRAMLTLKWPPGHPQVHVLHETRENKTSRLGSGGISTAECAALAVHTDRISFLEHASMVSRIHQVSLLRQPLLDNGAKCRNGDAGNFISL